MTEGGGRCVRGLDRHRRPGNARNCRAKSLDAPGGGDRPRAIGTPTRNAIGLSSPVVQVLSVESGELNPWRSILPPRTCRRLAFGTGGGGRSSASERRLLGERGEVESSDGPSHSTCSVWSFSASPVSAWAKTVRPLRFTISQGMIWANCSAPKASWQLPARMRADGLVVHAPDSHAEGPAGGLAKRARLLPVRGVEIDVGMIGGDGTHRAPLLWAIRHRHRMPSSLPRPLRDWIRREAAAHPSPPARPSRSDRR